MPTEAAQTALFAVEEDCERMRKIISEMETERTMNVSRMAHLRIEMQTANNAVLKLQTTGSAELQEAERRIQRAQQHAQVEVHVAGMGRRQLEESRTGMRLEMKQAEMNMAQRHRDTMEAGSAQAIPQRASREESVSKIVRELEARYEAQVTAERERCAEVVAQSKPNKGLLAMVARQNEHMRRFVEELERFRKRALTPTPAAAAENDRAPLKRGLSVVGDLPLRLRPTL